MTNEERQMFSRRLRERDAEIERLRAVCKDKTTLLKDAYAECERLRAALEPKP